MNHDGRFPVKFMAFELLNLDSICRYLSALRGTIVFDLENRVDDEIDEVCDMDNRYYELFDRGEEVRMLSQRLPNKNTIF